MTLLIGTVGGALFFWLGMPLAWMLGAMIFVGVAALAGMNLFLNPVFRSVMVTILGVFLGAAFNPEVLERAEQWAHALAVLALFIVLGSVCGYVFLRRVGGFDRVTAFFASTPGGSGEMALASESFGGDVATVSLVHTIRIIVIILLIPFWFEYALGAEAPAMMPPADGPPPEWIDWAILAGCAVLGWPLAGLCRLPAASLIGPMVLSAIAHLTAMTHIQPPPVPVAAAQVVLGAAIGSLFAGVGLRAVARTARLALATVGILLAATVGVSFVFGDLIGIPQSAMMLALAPGGLAEMSLIALALGIDTAFVSTMHICRIMLIITIAPALFRLFAKRPDA